MSNIDMANEFNKDGIPFIRTAFEKAGNQPDGWASDYFINANQEKVFYARIPAHTPDGGPARGTVILTTGYNDSVYNYYDTIRQWQQRGYDIYAMDWASQGASQRNPLNPNLPSSRPLSYHVRDMDQFIRHIVVPEATKPLILSTHSMGGAIGSLYMHDHPDTFDKAVLGAPMLDLDTSVLPREWFKNIAHAAKSAGLKDMSLPNWRDVLYKIKNIDLFHKTPPAELKSVFADNARTEYKPYEMKLPTWGWVNSAYQAMDQINKPGFFKDVKTEILFISAGHDELVDNASVRKAAETAPNARLLNLPTSQHGVWSGSEDNRRKIWNSVDALINNSNPIFYAPQQVAKEARKETPVSAPHFSPVFG